MEQKDVIAFFNRCAPTWDEEMVRKEDVIQTILDHAGIRPGIDVLDVACGTGVLFPDYFARGVRTVTGIDIAPEMAKRAREKYPQAQVICGDAETYPFGRRFDAVMVYNAFPHFPDPRRAVEAFASLTGPGGRLSIAHGMSRADLARHHSGAASRVSVELPDEQTLAAMLSPWFDVDVAVSDGRMYQVAGTRR